MSHHNMLFFNTQKNIHTKTNMSSGFTLIEVMIATLLFTVIMIIGMETLLSVTRSHRASQIVHQSLDSVSFAMEDMARNIRLGTTFSCANANVLTANPQDCLSTTNQYISVGKKLTFEPFNGDPANASDQMSYWIAQTGSNPSDPYTLYKSSTGDSGTTLDLGMYKSILSPNIALDSFKSGFVVVGACPKAVVLSYTNCSVPDLQQVRIVLRLVGTVTYQDITLPFDIQTTITPREPDL